jgi:hypothetical protein
MPDPDLTGLMDAAARALGLTIPDSSRAGVLRDMAVLLHQAGIAADSLRDAEQPVEIAPVFRP